ncbi:MAG: alpha/beta fold hydrolase, partial [Chloroflexota bacterium]|nr:alpha/beta fold hydrolase [Chloroflexota bacterium]
IGLMDIAHGLLDQGYNVFTIDFRAHGLSGGDRYSIGDWERRDVAGALAYLQSHGAGPIGAMGFSMGAGTLLRTTPDHPELRAVVLDSPFSDLEPIIERHFTEVSGLPPIFMPGILQAAQGLFGMDVLDNKPQQEMARLGSRPVFLIHSTGDDYIPVSQAYTLQAIGAADPHFQSWIGTGSAHVQMFKDHRAEYMQRVLAFFGTYLP